MGATTTLRDQSSLVYRFDVGTDGFWLARQLCEQWLRERHVRADAIADLLVVLSELCTVEAAAGRLVIRGFVDDDCVVLTVESPTPAIMAMDAPSGDLRLAAALCDELLIRVRPDRTTVTARRHGIVLPD